MKNYDFKNFDENFGSETRLEEEADNFSKIDENVIKRDREFAKINEFDIHPVLKERRGIAAQESAAKDEMIENEVQKKIKEIKNESFEKGYQEGKSKGEKDVYEQAKIEAEEKLDRLSEVIEEVINSKIKLIKKEKKQMYELISKISKWVILRELSDDGNYLERLLDNLAQEIESSSELIVRIDKESFKKMPEFVEYAKRKLTDFKNVKVEIGHDIEGPGIVLCSENEILSGTMEEQMKSLDKILSSCSFEDSGN